MSKYNDKVELVEAVCDTNLREIEIIVSVPYNGESTECYARAVYDEDGMRSMDVVTYDDYHTIYRNGYNTNVYVEDIDAKYVKEIEELLNQQL